MSELLPCPFCGGEARTVLADTYPHRGMLHSWFVECKDSECGCELGFYGMDENGKCGTYETEAEAIAAWNSRAERTCRNEWAEFGKFRCSECWTQVDAISTNTTQPMPIKHCPNCGAKVVR